ncbi:MAG TPA: RNA methyltransferase [Anaerolineae bacterium]|nr:RNA methyltransferase [Anaerolineae bacterium]
MSADEALFEGFISVRAALLAERRTLTQIWIQKNKWSKQIAFLERRAAARGIPCQRVAAEKISERAGGQTHGGILAIGGQRQLLSLANLYDLMQEADSPWVVMLDGVEDPYNFGQAVRSLYAAGAAGLVLRERNWLTATSIVTRASAGATEWMPTAVVDTAEVAADFFQERGFRVVTMADKGKTTRLYQADLGQAMFVLLGGEKRGVTRSFMDKADLLLEIPYQRDFSYSLGVTAATAVLAFEVVRQRATTIAS